MNKKSLFKFSFFFITLLMCTFMIGCSMVYQIDNFENSTKKGLNFVDARPDIEKTFRSYSRESIPIHRFGDENFSPDRMTILENAFQNKLNNSFSRSTVRITKFEVLVFCPKAINMSRGINPITFEMMFGPVLGRVLYDLKTPKGKDFFACQIEGDVDGKKFMAISKEEFEGLIDMRSAKKAVNKLIHRTIDIAAEDMNRTTN